MEKLPRTPILLEGTGPFKGCTFVSGEVVPFGDAAKMNAQIWASKVDTIRRRFCRKLPGGQMKYSIGFRAPLWSDHRSEFFNPLGSHGRFVAIEADGETRVDTAWPDLQNCAKAFFTPPWGLDTLVESAQGKVKIKCERTPTCRK